MSVSYTAPGAVSALLAASWSTDDLARAIEAADGFDLPATVDGIDLLRERLDELGRCLVIRHRLRTRIADIPSTADNGSMDTKSRATYCRCDEPARDDDGFCLACRLRLRDEIDCTVCGEPFTPNRSHAEHCSDACTKRAYRERQRQAVPA